MRSIKNLAPVRLYPISPLNVCQPLMTVRGLYPIESIPGMISLLAGKPNASTFPFSSFSFTSRSPVDDKEQAITIDGASLDEALQYGPTAGMPRLITWLEGLQEYSHARSKTEGTWSLSVGTGSQDLLSKVRRHLKSGATEDL